MSQSKPAPKRANFFKLDSADSIVDQASIEEAEDAAVEEICDENSLLVWDKRDAGDLEVLKEMTSDPAHARSWEAFRSSWLAQVQHRP